MFIPAAGSSCLCREASRKHLLSLLRAYAARPVVRDGQLGRHEYDPRSRMEKYRTAADVAGVA